ncbi:glycosyltransferase [Massilia norwichensis]|uniref:Glycosyltransferase n=1 Tax=Massilia norwichensis TaxID=1442366 RepID=A0ABT2A5H3_9BURK|nr:glycosyltransferase [Massilia norwichensis]MCS0589417.1 glycosyltransferase [Massilia norwichensis]
MRLLINASTLKVGGGVQVAVSLLNELKQIPNNEYFVVLSEQVSKQIECAAFPANFRFWHVESPAPLRARSRAVARLNSIEREVAPDAVLTVFGPAYWRPLAPHVCGFALPWLITPESPVHEMLNLRERIKQFLIRIYKWHHFKKEVDFLWCETEDVKRRLNSQYRFPLAQIRVVGNTHSAHFLPYIGQNADRQVVDDGTFRLLTVSAYYPHKNLEIIKKVIPHLVGRIRFCFVLTIPVEDFDKIFDESEHPFVRTLGPLSAAECPAAYAEADAVFLPTLLECFSANYPEAMVMRKPILTSNLTFATSLLENAALYFDPQDPEEIAQRILQLSSTPSLYAQLVENGSARLERFTSAEDRAKRLMQVCADASIGVAASGEEVPA